MSRKAKELPPANPPQEPPTSNLDGITLKNCATACVDGRCVITENRVCGHPHKVSHPFATGPVLERIQQARKIIAHQKVDRQ